MNKKHHHEIIECPGCNKIQLVKVEHTVPWYSYVHFCRCGYIIMESEWNNVNHINHESKF